jgi:hypothetical protein
LLGGRCNRCGWSANAVEESAAFEFHHPRKDKEFDLSSAFNKKWESIIAEIKKCELLCSRLSPDTS